MKKYFFLILFFVIHWGIKADTYTKIHDLQQIFNNNFTDVSTYEINKGYLVDCAVFNKSLFVLVQYFSDESDAIIKLDRESGSVISTWHITSHASIGIEVVGNQLWILTRRGKNFIIKMNFSGKIIGGITVKKRPPGKIYGFAIKKDKFYFSAAKDGKSILYSSQIGTSVFTQEFSVNEKIYSMSILNNKLYIFQANFDTYSSRWLFVYDLKKHSKIKMQFLPEKLWGMASDGKILYGMYRSKRKGHVFPFVVLEKQNMILGQPYHKTTSLTFSFGNKTKNPYTLDIYLPLPESRSSQNISNVNIVPKPLEYLTDRYGNKRARIRWEGEIDQVSASLSFDIIGCKIVYTLDKTYIFNKKDFPEEILLSATKETYCYDFSNPVILQAKDEIVFPDTRYISKIIAIRNFVNDKLLVVGPSGPESRASDFMMQGIGRCYAHGLSFAAVARLFGIPTRSVGGFSCEEDKKTSNYSVHTWNQVFFPKIGWIDIDAQADDDNKKGNHSYRYIGNSFGTYYITFEGEYDKLSKDYSAQGAIYTQRDWIQPRYHWSSDDRNNRAKVYRKPMTVYSK